MSLQESTDPSAEARWKIREVSLREIHSWVIRGRLGIKTDGYGWTASMHWIQERRRYVVRIIAALGQGIFQIIGDHGKASLLIEENKLLEANDLDALLADNLGWNIPILGMRYWVLGLPDPDTTIDERNIDESGRVIGLKQAGWNIIFSNYQMVDEYELPGRVWMESPNIKVKLVIKEWMEIT